MMRLLFLALCLLAVTGFVQARPAPWMPAKGHTQIRIWPGTAPDLKPMPGPENVWPGTPLLAGKP